MSFKQTLDVLIPKYTRLPLMSVLGLNMLVYFCTKLITGDSTHYDLTLAIDRGLPFVPAFIVIYVLAFLQWAVGYVLIARESRELCYRFLSGEMISKLICCAFFILLPTTMERPEVAGSGVFNSLVRLIYALDTPVNLLPSIHCLESWLCFRGSLKLRRIGPWYKGFSLVFTLLVFASTLLVKQHVIVDVFAGVAVGELGQLLAKATNSARFFERLEAPLQT